MVGLAVIPVSLRRAWHFPVAILARVFAPEPDYPDGPPARLRPIVESAAQAWVWWRTSLTASRPNVSDRPASLDLATTPAALTATTTSTPRAGLTLACYEAIAATWDPVTINPRGGHKRGRARAARQRNRDGSSMRQLAAAWGMHAHHSAAIGLAAFDELLACGAVKQAPDGSFLLTAPADARARISSMR